MRAISWVAVVAGSVALAATGGASGCGAGLELHDGGATGPAATIDDAPPPGRLDDRAHPVAYSVELDLDPTRSWFRGEVAIDVELARPARVVWLNARGLSIEHAAIRWGEERRAEATVVAAPSSSGEPARSGLLGLAVADPVPPGRATLELRYRGDLGAEVGLVRAGDTAPVVYADFEPNDARAAIPCFDDPRFKTPWTVSLVVPEWAAALSNAPEAGADRPEEGRRRVRFEPTMPLSSYLVAVAVGRLEVVRGAAAPVPIRVFVRPGNASLARTALSRAPAILEALARELDEPVPVPKLDLVAVPMASLRTRAMESPGLMTFSEGSLLLDERTPGPFLSSRRAELETVLTHELAHLWIGDLVTLDAWGDLWLNEGFATWLTGAILEQLDPARAATTASELSVVDMIEDETLQPRGPIRRAGLAPADADQMFILATYAGGAATLSTIEAWLGRARFQGALRGLVDSRREGTLSTADVVAAFDRAARDAGFDVDVAAMMSGLLEGSRTPRVTVSPRCEPGGAAVVELDVDTTPSAPFPMPLCFRWSGAEQPICRVVREHDAVPLDACPRWVHPNPGSRGLYSWRLRRGWVSPLVEQAPLSADDARALRAWVLPDVEENDLAGAASVHAYLAARGNSISWRRLQALERAAIEPATRPGFLAHLKRAAGAQRLGLDATSSPGQLAFAGWLAVLGDDELRAEARPVVEAALDGRRAPDLIVDVPAFAAAAAGGDDALFARMSRDAFDRGSKTSNVSLYGLGNFQGARAAERLRKVLRRPTASTSAVSGMLDGALSNPALRGDLVALVRSVAPSALSPSALTAVAGALCDPASFDELADAFQRSQVHESDASRAREYMLECAALRSRTLQEARSLWSEPSGSPDAGREAPPPSPRP